MPLLTLRPNGTVTGPGGVPSGTADAVLSDDNNSTFVPAYSGPVELQLSNPSKPAGSVAKSWYWALTGSSQYSDWLLVENGHILHNGAGYVSTNFQLPSGGAVVQTTSAATTPSDLSQTQIDALKIRFEELTGSDGTYPGYLHEAWVYIVCANPPTTTITTANNQTLTTSGFEVAYTHTPGTDGGPQQRRWGRLFTAAQYGAGGFDPRTSTPYDEVLDSGTGTIEWSSLPDGTYRTYVWTAQEFHAGQPQWPTANQYITTTLDLASLQSGVLSVVPTAGVGSVSIVVNRNTGTSAWDHVQVQRSTDGGVTWTPVRGSESYIPGANTVTVLDGEAPPGEDLTYRARAVTSTGIYGGWTTAASTVSWTATTATFSPVADPGTQFEACFVGFPDTSLPVASRVLYPLSTSLGIGLTGPRRGVEGSVMVRCEDQASEDVLVAALSAGVLVVHTPTSWRLRSGYYVPGNARPIHYGNNPDMPVRDWQIDLIQVEPPA